MTRKANPQTLTSGAALLLSQGTGLLVRHARDHADLADATIAVGSAARTLGDHEGG